MPKTQKELKQLKTEYETLTTKLKELTEEELSLVTGGTAGVYHEIYCPECDYVFFRAKTNVTATVAFDISNKRLCPSCKNEVNVKSRYVIQGE